MSANEISKAQKEDNPETFRKARLAMHCALDTDDGLYVGYQANVAMLLNDKYGITDYATRNQAAYDILRLIFDLKRDCIL